MTLTEFRATVREWLADNLSGEFAGLRGLGGPGREHEAFDERLAWDRHLAAAGWTCPGWPVEHGGQGLDLDHRVAFHEEYAASGAPARVNHFGEELLGPTLIALGTPEQQARFLPRIKAVEELWCQGYSEPGAGSDLASVSTTATLDDSGDAAQWVLSGQKVWTSLAHVAQWCFVLARTEPGSRRHAGLSYLLVPMDQPGVEVRPIVQLTGGSEFNEVFFDGARTARDLVVGEVGGGWALARTTLAEERVAIGAGSSLGEGVERLLAAHRDDTDPGVRERLGALVAQGLSVSLVDHRATLRRLGGHDPGPASSVCKLVGVRHRQDVAEAAVELLGAGGALARPEAQELLLTRCLSIAGGTTQVLLNLVGERILGLPRER